MVAFKRPLNVLIYANPNYDCYNVVYSYTGKFAYSTALAAYVTGYFCHY